MIMLLIGLLFGGIDFNHLQIKVGSAVVKYGMFIHTSVDFLIVAFSIFMFIKLISRLKKKEKIQEEATEPTLLKNESAREQS
ncbi:large conductance mechanosensitive channel protein [Bacillus sp. V2I10]|nr:large conductance mechanosensitive channel protein [Bacillus sp. V2I10]